MPQVANEGYRQQSQPADQVGPCPHCGERAWADLRDDIVVETLGEVETELQYTRGKTRRGVGLLLAVLVGCASIVLSWKSDGSILVCGPLLALVLIVLIRHAIEQIRLGRRPDHPIRWSYAPPPKRSRVATHVGPARLAKGELLQAPLSGTPCVAYELGVREDATVDAPAWTWMLLEQQVAQIEVNGQRVEPGRVGLTLTRTERTISTDDPAARTALRRRGLDANRPGLVIFESVVEAGDEVKLEFHRDGIARLRA